MRLFPFFSLFALPCLGVFAAGCGVITDEPTDRALCGLSDVGPWPAGPAVIVSDDRGLDLCGARVVARDGDVEAELRADPERCNHFAMPERRGFYEVTVERDGYAPAVSAGVRSYDGGCSGPGGDFIALTPTPVGCDGTALSSFEIELRDEAGLVCDERASVIVREGAIGQSLLPVPAGDGTCRWQGMPERPGAYLVSVVRRGYEEVTLRDVAVVKAPGACHVTPTKLGVQLVPAGRTCTKGVVQALDLDVRDASGAEVCDATATARDGAFEATLRPTPGKRGCTWAGLPERPGIYQVTVQKPGYEPAMVPAVYVTHDGCHVETENVSLWLQPARGG
ncbi:MAG TPA: carboxypeptidase-like regulatory domain-containing protein [Polyangiaceae bacterium]|nr:carboxypeptidase-like regulatory domain-containing protein [Polyangiaceae bacterium]